MPIDALSVFCAQLTRDLLAIAKFLVHVVVEGPRGCLGRSVFLQLLVGELGTPNLPKFSPMANGYTLTEC